MKYIGLTLLLISGMSLEARFVDEIPKPPEPFEFICSVGGWDERRAN